MPTLKERVDDLHQALRTAFPTTASLTRFSVLVMGVNLGGAADVAAGVSELVRWAVANGWEEDLLQKALEAFPNNPALNALAAKVDIPTRAALVSRFVRGSLATNLEIVGDVILGAMPLLVKIKPHYVVVSVLATDGGQIEKIVQNTQTIFEQASEGSGASRIDRMISSAQLVFSATRGIYVRIIAEKLHTEEVQALNQLCDSIGVLLGIAAHHGTRLAFHLSIRSYRDGDWSALRGVTISTIDTSLQDRAGSTEGHYQMKAANLIAATMGPRELEGQTTTSKDYGYEIFLQDGSDQSNIWSAYMARLFEHFWSRSERVILHRIERAAKTP